MKKYLPGLLAIIPAIFLYKMIFFGEIVTTNDELARHPINQWRDTYLAENDDMPQWFPNLFSGMPSYGGYIYMTGDPTKNLRNTILFNPGLKVWFLCSLNINSGGCKIPINQRNSELLDQKQFNSIILELIEIK